MAQFGIALGGGGSRAFVHLGVLARLAEAGVTPSHISGSSMGAVVGALFAADPAAERSVPRILEYFRKSSLFGGLVRQDKGDGLHRRPGLVGGLMRKMATASVASVISFRLGLRRHHPVNKAIDQLFTREGKRIEALRIPFGVNALDLTDGRLEEWTEGPLAPALKAGVAIGLVFAPYRHNDRQYADAAPVCPVPVRLCRRLGAKTVLAVDICAPLTRPLPSYTGFDVVRRIMSIQSETLNEQEVERADVLLKIDASDVFWGDFSRIDELVERGRAAAGDILDKLREKLDLPENGTADKTP